MGLSCRLGCQNKKSDDLSTAIPGTGWANTEYRSFNFVHLHGNSTTTNESGAINNAHTDDYEHTTFRETEESRSRRGKVEPQHGREVQQELFRTATQGWEDQATKITEEHHDTDEEEEELKSLVRVLTKDSEIADKIGGEAPATHRRGEVAADAAKKERERRNSVNVTAVAA